MIDVLLSMPIPVALAIIATTWATVDAVRGAKPRAVPVRVRPRQERLPY